MIATINSAATFRSVSSACFRTVRRQACISHLKASTAYCMQYSIESHVSMQGRCRRTCTEKTYLCKNAECDEFAQVEQTVPWSSAPIIIFEYSILDQVYSVKYIGCISTTVRFRDLCTSVVQRRNFFCFGPGLSTPPQLIGFCPKDPEPLHGHNCIAHNIFLHLPGTVALGCASASLLRYHPHVQQICHCICLRWHRTWS